MNHYLIIGADSFMGHELETQIKQTEKDVSIDKTTRKKKNINKQIFHLDLSDNIISLPYYKYDTVFFCAGITSILQCEQQPALAERCNYINPLKLIEKFSEAGCKIFFPSTNLVFDGSQENFTINHPLSPQVNYGRLKANLEESIRALNTSHTIIRCTKLLAEQQSMIFDWAIKLIKGESIQAFYDMNFAPINGKQAVNQMLELSKISTSGTWHLSTENEITYYNAALWIAEILKVESKLVLPIAAQEKNIIYNPPHSSLDMSETKKTLNLSHIASAKEVIKEFILKSLPLNY